MGARANPACIGNGATSGQAGKHGSGGGGGFGGAGGVGGAADANKSDPALEGGKGGTALVSPPSIVRGGCAGADSGDGSGRSADGGDSGGAIQLSAANLISISGTVHAGGTVDFLDGDMAGPLDNCGGEGGGRRRRLHIGSESEFYW